MSNIYIREATHTVDYEQEASEAVEEGRPVIREVGGGVREVDPSADGRIDALVPHRRAADGRLLEDANDYTSYQDVYVFDAGDGPVPVQPLSANDDVRLHTVIDEAEPAPSFQLNEEVGVAPVGGDLVVVPAGYTDSGGTQYGDGGTGAYLKLGRANEQTSDYESIYNKRIAVRVADDNL